MTQNIPIFLSSDDNYAPFVATTMLSILENTKSSLDFYVLDGGISEENKNRIKAIKGNYSIEFLKVDFDKYFKGFKELAHLGMCTYNRLLMPFLKPELKKVLYLDVDIIVKGDIKELHEQSLDGYAVGAVWERGYDDEDLKKSLELSPNHKYFNAGILLVDLEKLRKDDFFSKCLEIEGKYREQLKWADQDILNKYFENNYKELDEKYNYTAQNAELNPGKDFIIRHYTTSLKPWHIKENVYTNLVQNADCFWYYAKITPFYDEILSKVKYQDAIQLRFLELMQRKNKERNQCKKSL